MTTNHKTDAPLATKQILLVDDDRLVLAMMSGGLRDAGYHITSAESAEEARAWLASGARPDLAILDVRMPGEGGLSLAQRLRELDHIPFIMLSAYSDPDMVAQATACGALGYIVKPQEVTQLIPVIEAALARANELSDLRTTRQQLQAALNNERDISIAVGITMMQHHLKRSDAFELLRKSARSQRIKLADLAVQVIAAGEALSF
ncbi:MAG: response regulator [Rhodoferax sp.]|jgi:response regulator NasT|nr:response regulator [Rhodoferax sp.]MBP9685179.1 response regulator [Rhodoferax sp.]